MVCIVVSEISGNGVKIRGVGNYVEAKSEKGIKDGTWLFDKIYIITRHKGEFLFASESADAIPLSHGKEPIKRGIETPYVRVCSSSAFNPNNHTIVFTRQIATWFYSSPTAFPRTKDSEGNLWLESDDARLIAYKNRMNSGSPFQSSTFILCMRYSQQRHSAPSNESDSVHSLLQVITVVNKDDDDGFDLSERQSSSQFELETLRKSSGGALIDCCIQYQVNVKTLPFAIAVPTYVFADCLSPYRYGCVLVIIAMCAYIGMRKLGIRPNIYLIVVYINRPFTFKNICLKRFSISDFLRISPYLSPVSQPLGYPRFQMQACILKQSIPLALESHAISPLRHRQGYPFLLEGDASAFNFTKIFYGARNSRKNAQEAKQVKAEGESERNLYYLSVRPKTK
ncbi:uncharacterized protein BDR25DRAFT_349036 [Lindgomyces ingoldianus]|uniref:Uncharacterized protein n=1 Tax=Lindgomyces ingoldianus TaxID=673940 RepID=A0ACB6RFP1_9PLEO|nr:uncharacterized protein BDR25DRAFT_349036 [Lindgomyces ingoldianus]KAF2477142.1 hypothetical protein BDR25DRAFT_349036 [Lindgomyces ingoldianus]